ncbi:MAG: hypothetical protein JXQ90_20200 [Cyclobacteriaceae bacterium]
MKSIATLLLSLFVGLNTSLAGEFLQTQKSAKFKYDVSSSTLINIKAKNTILEIESHTGAYVEFEAILEFKGEANDEMLDFLDNYEARVKEGVAVFGDELGITSDLKIPNKREQIGLIIGYKDDELRMTYRLKVPRNNAIEIKSSYRDMTMKGAYTGPVVIDHYSGEIEAGSFDKLELKLKYGQSRFESIGMLKVELYEEEFKANEVKAVKGVTKYSDVDFGHVGIVELESYEDNLSAEEVASISGVYKYGEMRVSGGIDKLSLTSYEWQLESNNIEECILNESKYSRFKSTQVGKMRFVDAYEDRIEVERLGSLDFIGKYVELNIGTLQESLKVDGYETDVELDNIGSDANEIFLDGKYNKLKLNLDGTSIALDAKVKYGNFDYDKSAFDVVRHIRDGSELEIEMSSVQLGSNETKVVIRGYEIDVDIN